MMGKYACIFADWWTAINRKAIMILIFTPACAAFIGIGAVFGQTQLFLLIVTTVLSVDSSLGARMVMLKQAQSDGDEPKSADVISAVESK